MTKNGLTIHLNGGTAFAELNEQDAARIDNLVRVLNSAPRDDREPGEWAPDHVARAKRSDEQQLRAIEFSKTLTRLAAVDEHKMPLVLSLLDLIELGESRMSGSNWALEFIESLLSEVSCSGPAGLLENDPRGILAGLANDLFDYWDTIRMGRELTERHPTLFPAPPAEPEVVADPATTAKRAKAPRARKARKKAA